VITNNESGVLVPPNDPRALAFALHELLQQPQRREQLRIKARQRVEAHFSMDVFRRQMLKCLETLDLKRNGERPAYEATPLPH
jgi:glycosyltransferase involved in cell wall biosynthesis